jgi:hypothetical protein
LHLVGLSTQEIMTSFITQDKKTIPSCLYNTEWTLVFDDWCAFVLYVKVQNAPFLNENQLDDTLLGRYSQLILEMTRNTNITLNCTSSLKSAT